MSEKQISDRKNLSEEGDYCHYWKMKRPGK